MRSNMLAKLIREGNTSTDKIICCEIGRLFDRLSDYLYLYDMDKGTVFYGVFCLVFLNGENESYEEIASRLHVASPHRRQIRKKLQCFCQKADSRRVSAAEKVRQSVKRGRHI